MKKKKEIKSNNGEVIDAIDYLALITKKGFDRTASKQDLKSFGDEIFPVIKEMTDSLYNLDSKLNDVDSRLKKIEDMLEPMFTGYTIMKKEIQSLNFRLDKLERKNGMFVKGR